MFTVSKKNKFNRLIVSVLAMLCLVNTNAFAMEMSKAQTDAKRSEVKFKNNLFIFLDIIGVSAVAIGGGYALQKYSKSPALASILQVFTISMGVIFMDAGGKAYSMEIAGDKESTRKIAEATEKYQRIEAGLAPEDKTIIEDIRYFLQAGNSIEETIDFLTKDDPSIKPKLEALNSKIQQALL